ncbi:magnesium transporter CorA family protein [Paenibacillus bouchesdurhonensis]|uniref:magnesium transporter CorA family protein n=1 Tax=Paenibacillus bouchesdurhonensis TaxID=1870990 RepID=UPI000DA6321C|nr:magnesium transporter CorA family protein [Paenibacillus bouchesdurhonensis]
MEYEKHGQRIIAVDQGWSWHDLEFESLADSILHKLRQDVPDTEEWLDIIPSVDTNYLSVRFPDGKKPIIFGSLVYSVEEEMQEIEDCVHIHFFVNQDRFITLNLDAHTRERMHMREKMTMLHDCRLPIEGMFVLIRTILHYIHVGMDRFEKNLRKVEETMKKHNKKHLMDQILTSRFELLYWSNLFIPFQEIVTAAQEAYLEEELEHSAYFRRLIFRTERMNVLFRHYEKEIDTLISIDEAVSAFRGNDIMKTLTIMTAIFTPATVIGAIWGMNFDFLPWVKTGMTGFLIISSITIFSTLAFYLWMNMKGWTGDLLQVNKKDSHL